MAWESERKEEPDWTVEEALQFSIDELRRLWIELGRAGYRAGEIRKILPSGHSYGVIQQYLRDKIPSRAERILELYSETENTADIARAVRVSERRVQQILRNVHGPAKNHNTTDTNIDRFLYDPEKYMKAEFTQSPTFGWGLLRRCVRIVDENPMQGLETVEPTVALFDRIRRTRRRPWTWRSALCRYVQSRGIESHVYAVTSRPVTALSILTTTVTDEMADCLDCEADRQRRVAVVYVYWGRLEEANAAANDATEKYRALGTSGHDLYGNGLANCHLLNSKIHYDLISPAAGAAEAREGLSKLTGKESSTLQCYLVFALATCLVPSKDPREVDESSELLDLCFDQINAAGRQSEARAMLHWLKGQLLTVRGQRDEAIDCLTLALEDAEACLLSDVGDILADLAALNPDPKLIRNHIEDFCDWDEKGNLIVPSWCKNLEREIRPVYDLVFERKAPIDISIFSSLREATGRERRMPSFFIPPPSTSPGLQAWDALR